MNKNYTPILRIFFIFVVLFMSLAGCMIFGSASKVSAQTIPENAKGLTLSPLRSELNITPGTSLDGVLSVTNSTNKTMTVDFSAEEFRVINQQYDYAFTEESDVAKWVTFNSSEGSLSAGETKKIPFTVGVPLSAEPGGRYISLFASTDAGSQDGGVNSRQRVVSLLYITVIGDVTRSGNLVSLTSPWLTSDKSAWSVVLQNTGTTHFRSRYDVQVKDIFWGGTAASMTGSSLILPGTVRLVSDTLPSPQIPGLYKVVYVIGLGDTPADTEIRLMLYMPPWATIVFTITAIALGYWLFRRRLSKR